MLHWQNLPNFSLVKLMCFSSQKNACCGPRLGEAVWNDFHLSTAEHFPSSFFSSKESQSLISIFPVFLQILNYFHFPTQDTKKGKKKKKTTSGTEKSLPNHLGRKKIAQQTSILKDDLRFPYLVATAPNPPHSSICLKTPSALRDVARRLLSVHHVGMRLYFPITLQGSSFRTPIRDLQV